MSLYLIGALTMFGMCAIARYSHLLIALPVNLFIWWAVGKLCGVYP